MDTCNSGTTQYKLSQITDNFHVRDFLITIIEPRNTSHLNQAGHQQLLWQIHIWKTIVQVLLGPYWVCMCSTVPWLALELCWLQWLPRQNSPLLLAHHFLFYEFLEHTNETYGWLHAIFFSTNSWNTQMKLMGGCMQNESFIITSCTWKL